MIEKDYPISFEVAGRTAVFSRPDTASTPVSYACPTPSALKGLVESIVYSKDAYFFPEKVEICAPVIYAKYTSNYGGPERKKGVDNMQIFMTVLQNVVYKVYGSVKSYGFPRKGSNPQHKYQEIFQRRLKKGLFHSTPFLGMKDFPVYYMGEIREETQVDTSINLTIPSMLNEMYDRPTEGKLSPSFLYDLKIENGVVLYAK